jgi:hypothetical protein
MYLFEYLGMVYCWAGENFINLLKEGKTFPFSEFLKRKRQGKTFFDLYTDSFIYKAMGVIVSGIILIGLIKIGI